MSTFFHSMAKNKKFFLCKNMNISHHSGPRVVVVCWDRKNMEMVMFSHRRHTFSTSSPRISMEQS